MLWMRKDGFNYVVRTLKHISTTSMTMSRTEKSLIILNLPSKAFRIQCGMNV